MTHRRDVLKLMAAATAAGLFAGAGRSDARPAAWRPFRDTLAVDGEGAVFALYAGADPAEAAAEFASVRASGLSGTLLTIGRNAPGEAAFEETKKAIAFCTRKIAEHPDMFVLIGTAADLEHAKRGRRLGVVLRFQGAEPLGDQSDRVSLFRSLGVRVIQLTHQRRNRVGDGCMEPDDAGLSDFGRRVVERLNAEKVVVDLAHGSERTIAEGIRASKVPVLVSHTGCRALADFPRNTSDENLRALADRGGVAGIILWPYLRTDRQPMAIDVVRHIEHAIKVCGEDHVGIGTDGGIAPVQRTPEYEKGNRGNIEAMIAAGALPQKKADGVYLFIPDLNVADRFDVLAGMLSARGHSDARIAKILGGNFARVFAEVWGE
ncbi:membrane dipeptidase [Dokdonella sp.]|uniref:dipeptidase n=1 Tax=Dokdonella sp. TaxID=2291710 RepID=UPI00260583CA|nr:membrane dipeptidase [Dokdonella sp.]